VKTLLVGLLLALLLLIMFWVVGFLLINGMSSLVSQATGRQLLLLRQSRRNQALNPEHTTVWVAAEQWVPEYAEMCGEDSSRVIVIETNIMEEAFDAVLAFAESEIG